ncbi:MAG: Rpn family recombination-promoting nuclease/putative transposase [Leptospirales bacterium]|nr:Rpn family recombination-promoting nuclease/putative transposase [Leptospirales bacterium]
MAVNKKYKDSVFRSIFNNKRSLLELYNAINGTDYQDESIIEINTLKNVIFSSRKNDISFTVNKKMVVLIEHQSTIDENMPLRIASYIIRIYEKIINKKIYRDLNGKLPRPEFIVLYNGKDPLPEERYLRLSDSFVELNESEKTKYSDLIFLDILVLMLNINKGCNQDLERKSRTLNSYTIFVAKVREYEKKHALEEAVKLAVKYCIKKRILKDYFEQNSPEDVSMNFIQYNEKDAMKELRKETKELRKEAQENLKKGMEKGLEKGMEKGLEKGLEKGMEQGQNYILELMAQGLSYEEIKKKISQKKH